MLGYAADAGKAAKTRPHPHRRHGHLGITGEAERDPSRIDAILCTILEQSRQLGRGHVALSGTIVILHPPATTKTRRRAQASLDLGCEVQSAC